MIEQIKHKIHNLVQKYEQNREHYRTSQFNETQVRNEFLDPLFEILGWDIRNTSCKSTSECEVLLEESLKANASTHSKKPDYTFRLYGERKFFLEAKKPCVDICQEDEPAKQVRRYGYTAGLKISVLSNFEDLFIYDTSCPVEDADSLFKARIKAYHYTGYEEAAEELLRLIGKDSVYNGHFDEEWQDINLNVEHVSVDKLFLDQINAWRLMLGKQILSAKPDIDIDNLGDVVQSYINKILFLRVCEDRNIETYQALLNIADHNSHRELVSKFRKADTKYNSGLFKELLSESIINNVSSSFWTIIKQLYFPESPYSFAVLSSDILGRIYEIFIAQKLDVVDDGLVIVDKPENVERDIVTTPNFVIREILRQTASEIIIGKNDAQINSLKCADIACGSGAFLLELYQYLYDALVDYYRYNDLTKLIQTNVNTYKLPFDIKRDLLLNCIYGVDKDFNAVEACKFGLLLKLLEDEDVNSLSAFHPILPNLDQNIFFGNSLLSSENVPSDLIEEINPFDFGERKFDLIVGNPPYMKTEDIKKFTPNEKKLYEKGNLYVSANKQYDKYFLFIERAIGLLKSDGYLGYIVPSKFMKVGAASNLRGIIASNRYLKSIISFGAHQIFEDKTTYTCIVILQKKEHNNFEYAEVRNLNGWKVRSSEGDSFGIRPSTAISDATWVLYPDDYAELFKAVTENTKNLSEIVGHENIFNGIQTSANNEYIFTPIKEDEHNYTFYYKSKKYLIEKSVTKPYYKTERGKEKNVMSAYKTFKPNARVIFPYDEKNKSKLELIPLETIESRFPLLYKYLRDIKPILTKPTRNIQPKPKTENEWHRYGRHQNLVACDKRKKIIVGVNSFGEQYAIDKSSTFVTSGGTAGYCLITVPENSGYSIYYIQALLCSKQVEWLASLYGEIYHGGSIARGTKVLAQMPLHTIDFENQEEKAKHDAIVCRQKQIIDIGDKLAAIKGNKRKQTPLLRQFDSLKQEQQRSINELYGMTESQVSRIPIIKDLYAAN